MQESRQSSMQLKQLQVDSLSGSRDAEKQVFYSRRAPLLQGSTNGTLGPSQGDQFSSAAAESSNQPFVNNAPVSAPTAAPASPAAAQFGVPAGGGGSAKDLSFSSAGVQGRLMAKMKAANDSGAADFREEPTSRSDVGSNKFAGKEEVSEKKQAALKKDSDASGDQFNDDEVDTQGGDEIVASAPADKSGETASPVVPESDTYLLFGVGMLVLAFALKTGRKVKKA